MSDAIEQMKNLFGIANKCTIENLGYTDQTNEIIVGADKISKIKFCVDQLRKGLKVIRLELS